METVQTNQHTDNINNNMSQSSSSNYRPTVRVTKYYNKNYKESASDNELDSPRRSRLIKTNSHYKSTGNLSERDNNKNIKTITNSISNIDLNLHSSEIKKFDSLQIPIVGYEVMEERARFTIYKLKVEDDKRDQSWLVFRRYTDFVRLYSRIKNELPNIMLPLPGKRWFRDNFEPAFLEERVRGLQVFINAVLAKLPMHPIVREFFCLDEPPQVFSYQPEVQAVYGALEDSILSLKMQLKQKDATILHLQQRVADLETLATRCGNCSAILASNAM